ncbi:protein transport protein Sec24A [Belonocnema kinseyi]|uniref:protein transport protein Sec24A n=1 Tax=Belonocnema kinseyi TaxID=2817044 RepID=UPI00143CF7F2|nr:protein transport protein Sec24A [Belonocnema kinseyi]XP_033231400.1 protein transport protein Sec24A [Belonocnema kinseyi]XP_033231482.1 protein transport protein Sec24A [Belonocnema kinseyi]
MSQLGNYYQTNPDADSTLKSGPPPVLNGQPSAIQPPQNGGQFYSGTTPSSQSSRDPSRDASRDGSPTQYLRNPGLQSQWRPQMPPINGKQPSPQNPSPISHSRVPQNQPSPVPPLQFQNPSSLPGGIPAATGGMTIAGAQVPINSQSAFQKGAMSVSNPVTLESKPKTEPFFSSRFPDSDSSSQKIQGQTNHLPTLSPSNQSQPNIPTPSDPKPISNPVALQSQNFQNQNYQQSNPNYQPNQSSNQNFQNPQSIPRPPADFGTNPPNPGGQSFHNKMGSQNFFSNQNPPPMQNLSSAQMFANAQPIQKMGPGSSPRFAPPIGNQYGIPPPIQNIPNIPNVPNIPKVQNLPAGGQNVPNLQNVNNPRPSVLGGESTNFLAGSAPPQGQNLYSAQQNLASQANKYPPNPHGAAQLTYTNLAGPPLTNQQKPPMTNFQAGAHQKPLSGMQPPVQQQNPYDTRPPYPGQMSNVPLDNMNKRYPTAYPDQMNQVNNQMSGLNVTQAGFNKLWGMESVDLLQCRNILPPEKIEPPRIKLQQEFLDQVNCSPDIFRCTLTKIPESNSLLQKSRLPLGVLIHPFKDLYHLAVIQCSTIVRCRSCRTYINPFVYFVDSKRWKCNLCYRVNELPDEFQFDPATKSYGDPSRRPEVKTSTIEFIAPSEYMLRPPQPAVYLFVFDVSRLAVESGYLSIVCKTIGEELSKMPGDGRMQVGFIAVDSGIHFFSMPDGVSQPHEMIMLDVEDVFLPCPENLIVNLKEREVLVRDLLEQLPTKFEGTHDIQSALGAGLQAAYKLMAPTGGRIAVFQTCLPNLGPGALQSREDPNTRTSKDVPHLNPVTDFYKRIALDCSSQQIAVDLFLLNCQYSDLATLSGMCKFSGGCIYHLPLFRSSKPQFGETLDRMLRRYLTRKIGFEAVMRIRCTRGLGIHTFHGNFFVRSTDLLTLPNVNPDAGFGMQVSIDENLSDVQNICFQAALLYTSSKGERRIRVHTLCLPVTNSLTDILYSADSQCIIGLLSKMAVDRSLQSSLSDARDALINAAIDMLSAYKLAQSSSVTGLIAPDNLKLLPLYIIALLKCVAFRSGMNTRLDDRVYAMCQLKTLPLSHLIQTIYPDLYPVHALDDKHAKDVEGRVCPQPPRLHLSAEKLDSRGVFLLDTGDKILIYVGKNVSPTFCSNVFGFPAFASIPEEMYELPELATPESERLHNFIWSLQEEKPFYATLQIIRDDSHFRTQFTERLIEDRFESALSYYEFLQHLKPQIK